MFTKVLSPLSTSESRSFHSTNYQDIGSVFLSFNFRIRGFHSFFENTENLYTKEGYAVRHQLNRLYLKPLIQSDLPKLENAQLKYNKLVRDNEESEFFEGINFASNNVVFSAFNKTNSNLVLLNSEYYHLGFNYDLIYYSFYLIFTLILDELQKKLPDTSLNLLYEFLNWSFNRVALLDKARTNRLDAFVLKELFISLLSFIEAPNDYYYYGSPKFSVIKEFLDSFLLLNLHYNKISFEAKRNISLFDAENTLYQASKKGILLFLDSPFGPTCAPIILDQNNHFNISLTLSLK